MDEKAIMTVWKRGGWFLNKFNSLSPKIQLKGFNTKAVFVGDELYRWTFFQEMVKRKVIFGKAWHIWLAHDYKILEEVIEKCREVVQEIDDGNVVFEGLPPTPIFTTERR